MDATKHTWKEIFESELRALYPILETLEFILDEDQPHISGERFLMTRNKLVLSGTEKRSGAKIIIKAAIHPDGKQEIKKEKLARDTLKILPFARDVLLFPREILFKEIHGWLLFLTEYIAQEKVFVEHTTEEQFFLILRAFEAQESFHATTFEHLKGVEKIFPIHHATEYISTFKEFVARASRAQNTHVSDSMSEALELLTTHKTIIDQFGNYLVHTDFVPHNFRVASHALYVLDAAAVEFGNKYEGWARLLNYMVIHNPELEHLLVKYLKTNRSSSDMLSLKLMRMYKIGFLIDYYLRSIEKTQGDLRKLTERRIEFWNNILQLIVRDLEIPVAIIEEYKNERDSLRSNEEKERQKEFAIA